MNAGVAVAATHRVEVRGHRPQASLWGVYLLSRGQRSEFKDDDITRQAEEGEGRRVRLPGQRSGGFTDCVRGCECMCVCMSVCV